MYVVYPSSSQVGNDGAEFESRRFGVRRVVLAYTCMRFVRVFLPCAPVVIGRLGRRVRVRIVAVFAGVERVARRVASRLYHRSFKLAVFRLDVRGIVFARPRVLVFAYVVPVVPIVIGRRNGVRLG